MDIQEKTKEITQETVENANKKPILCVDLAELLQKTDNKVIKESLINASTIINKYNNVVCAVSGGSDSDLLVDICERVRDKNLPKVNYVFFDTGLEYKATKEHIEYLNEKYGIEINVRRPKKPIPTACKEYGQPFLSKQVSELILRLQRHDFKWEDKSYEELIKEYPRCISALKWWCNCKGTGDMNKSMFDISRNKWLKEFLVQNPPQFKISNKCCTYAKKNLAHEIEKEFSADLTIVGVRKSEGGARATSYKSCFSDVKDKKNRDEYRPIFWYLDDDKKEYNNSFDVCNSKCYTEYGLKRTGCTGCPYGRNLEQELEVLEKYEPNLYKAANYVFKDTYEYTRQYREFVKMMNEKEKLNK